MERPALKKSPTCINWTNKERLGTGGFGHVYLYQHNVSFEQSICCPEEKKVRADPSQILLLIYSGSRRRERRLLWNFAAWTWMWRIKNAGAGRFKSWGSKGFIVWLRWSYSLLIIYTPHLKLKTNNIFVAIFVLQAEPCEYCSGQRSSRRCDLHRSQWPTSACHGVLCQRRSTQGTKGLFYKELK